MTKKKRIVFYLILSTGHVNVCASVSKVLLDRFQNEIDIYFIVDKLWKDKLAKMDSRFIYAAFEYMMNQELII